MLPATARSSLFRRSVVLSEEVDHENDQACVITDRRGDRHSQHPAVEHEDVQEIRADVHDCHNNDREQRFRFIAVKLHDRLKASRKCHGGDSERETLHVHAGVRKQIAVAPGCSQQDRQGIGKEKQCKRKYQRDRDTEDSRQGKDRVCLVHPSPPHLSCAQRLLS